MALVGAAVEGATLYVFTVPSIRTATLCTPVQLPSTGARVPAVAVAAGFSPVAVKTMGVPSAPSGRKPASSCVQAASERTSAASAKNLVFIISVVLLLWFFPLRAELFPPATAYCFLKVGNAPLSS